jgi:phosphate:Na+ symporter
MKKTSVAILLLCFNAMASMHIELSGDHQTGSVGSTLGTPMSVTLTDSASGEPVSGADVYFSIRTDRGSSIIPLEGFASAAVATDSAGGITRMLVITDRNGRAGIRLHLPSEMGPQEVSVQITAAGRMPEAVSFSHVAVDVRQISFQMLGGLALFLLGMKMMSDGLQHVAGNRMKTILRKITSNRFSGVLAGLAVTGIIQSSSATTVILVSFVNAGLMSLQQAIGVILGANIGTTVTGQLIAFRLTEFAYPMLAAGFLLSVAGRSGTSRFWGRTLLGLGILLLGMNTMKAGLDPLRDSQPVRDFFMSFSRSAFLGIVAGTMVTCVIQSSSATVGLVMTLAGSGLISLQGAVYLVLGDNIGTTITAQLAAIGTNKAARRAAMAHTMFNLVGAAYFGLLLARPGSFYMNLVESSSAEPMRQVANAHTLFNVFNVLMFLPLVPLLARLCQLIIPGKDVILEEGRVQLGEHLLSKPVLAVDEIERAVQHMARYTVKCVRGGMEHFRTGRPKADEILSMESHVDEMQSAITIYTSRLFEQDMERRLSLRVPVLLHTINDLERVSDQAVNMLEARGRLGQKQDGVGQELRRSAEKAIELVSAMMDDTILSLEKRDRTRAEAVITAEGKLNALDAAARDQYTLGLCTPSRDQGLGGLATLDFVNYCEKVGDHLTNIAQSVLGGGIWHGEEE